MLSILLLCGALSPAVSSDQQGDGTQKRFVYAPQGHAHVQPPLLFPVPSPVVDIGPVELDYPVKMVQKFTDSDGNVQVVTSYSNRKDNDQPIYRSRPAPPIYRPVAYNLPQPPNARSSAIEMEARSVPKKHQVSRTQTIKFPDANGQIVDHEEKTSFRDGNAKSFRTESSYDNSYKKPLRPAPTRAHPTPRAQYTPQPTYDDEDDDYSAEPQVEDEVAVRSALKQVNKKDVNVKSGSATKPVRRPDSGSFRSAKPSPASSDDGPIAASKKSDHVLEPAGSTYIADIEEVDSGDEDDYDKSDGYDEHHGGIDVSSHGIGHGHGGLDHGPDHHGHGHGHNKNFKKEGGQSYTHGEHFAKGEKGGKGHKSKESYDKGHVEKHGHEHNSGGKKIEEGEKKGHVDEANSYHKGHTHHKGDKGSEKSHSKGHKKGHKTKGFRTVHHKDEYKKDEVFYDEEHDAGHEKHHGHEQGGHQEAKGGESKKGHLDSGYKDAVKGLEGEKKEGHTYEHSKGHAAQQGQKGHEGHKEGFHKGAGHKGEEAHGHVSESKGKGW